MNCPVLWCNKPVTHETMSSQISKIFYNPPRLIPTNKNDSTVYSVLKFRFDVSVKIYIICIHYFPENKKWAMVHMFLTILRTLFLSIKLFLLCSFYRGIFFSNCWLKIIIRLIINTISYVCILNLQIIISSDC